jgi:hypothetical protein
MMRLLLTPAVYTLHLFFFFFFFFFFLCWGKGPGAERLEKILFVFPPYLNRICSFWLFCVLRGAWRVARGARLQGFAP